MRFSCALRILLVCVFILMISGNLAAQEGKVEEAKKAAGEKAAENTDKKPVEDQDKKAEEEEKKESPWKSTVIGGVNFSQNSYSNWAKGGQNSIAWNLSLDSDFKRNGGKWDWVLENDMSFGMAKQEKEKPRTTLDRIDIDCTLAWKAAAFVNPYFSMGLLSQFTQGFDYSKDPPVAKSNFFDPAYLI